MKTIKIFVVLMLSAFVSFSQKVLNLQDKVTMELPSMAKPITKTDALSHVNKTFNNKIISNSLSGTKSDELYLIDNILISLRTQDIQANSNYLTERKNGIDAMYKSDATYKSYIQKINNNNVLVINYRLTDGNEYYRFYVINAVFSKSVFGFIVFNNSDLNKANDILKELLNRLKFKEQ